MRILSYSPSVEVYVATHDAYYDLTQDVISCSVNRQLDGTSTFTFRVANRKHKYNGMFAPMDRVTIFANKSGEKTQLITGYMTNTSLLTLYEEDFVISGEDTLLRLERLYFDPGMNSSYQLALGDIGANMLDANGTQFAYDLLTKIGGWDPSMVRIDSNIPSSVIDWARRLYAAQQSDFADSEKMLKEFYELLRSSSAAVTSSGSTSSSSTGTYSGGSAKFSAMRSLWESHKNQWSYGNSDNGRLTPESSGFSDCSACVWWAANKIDPSYSWLGTRTYSMLTTARHIIDVTSPCYLDTSKMEPGDLIIMAHQSGVRHVDWYFGDGVAWGAGCAPLPHFVTDDVAHLYASGSYYQRWVSVCRFLDQTGPVSS